MARIGILTCSNCVQETHCSSVVCFADMRKRRGFFNKYPKNEPLDLVGIISCSGCPTIIAPEKILRRVRAVAEFGIDALHFSYCMTALCPFISQYQKVIGDAYPNIELISGTHKPIDKKEFQRGVKEIICPTMSPLQSMNELINSTLKLPDGALKF